MTIHSIYIIHQVCFKMVGRRVWRNFSYQLRWLKTPLHTCQGHITLEDCGPNCTTTHLAYLHLLLVMFHFSPSLPVYVELHNMEHTVKLQCNGLTVWTIISGQSQFILPTSNTQFPCSLRLADSKKAFILFVPMVKKHLI